jgi:hypothetical protein
VQSASPLLRVAARGRPWLGTRLGPMARNPGRRCRISAFRSRALMDGRPSGSMITRAESMLAASAAMSLSSRATRLKRIADLYHSYSHTTNFVDSLPDSPASSRLHRLCVRPLLIRAPRDFAP